MPVLLLLVASLPVIIGGLVVRLRRQKQQLREKQEYLVRYITYYLELKKQVPDVKEPYPFDPPEITPEEFTKVIDNMLRRILFLSLFVLFALPLAAQEAVQDSAYVFRFPQGKEVFFVPYLDNAAMLDRLTGRLDSCRAALDGGCAYVSVTGYIARSKDERAARRMGYLRNSHVKSELITRAKLTERMFVTDRVIVGSNADGFTEVVVVTFPAPVAKVAQIAGTEAATRVEAYNREVRGEAERERRATERAEAEHLAAEQAARERAEAERLATEQSAAQAERERAEAERRAAQQAEQERSEAARLQAEAEAAGTNPYTFAVRANLLRWATLTPDLGVEWRISPTWSVAVSGSWTSWSWDGKNRRYALWEVSPEVRYYIGKEKRGYVGAMFKAGEFNYKLSATGKQGDLTGGGITGGYVLRLNKCLALDFNAGLGCIHADYEKYTVIDGVRVRQGKETKNRWGPIHAGVTLMWKLF